MSLTSASRLIAGIALSLSTAAAFAAPVLVPDPPEINASSYILMEATTGKVVAEHNADERLPPASLTKMMTAYIVEKELAEGRLSLDDAVPVSVKAWKTGGSRMFIREGTNVKLEDLLQGVIIQSGNDASVALAEFVAGSEDAFVDIMNQQASLLGMENTRFDSATGLPRTEQYSSARDLAVLATHIINDYPENYRLYAQKEFTFAGIRQPNRNKLLWRDDRVDGLKTGYTIKAKYCLVASGKEGDTRFVAVVMGARSPEARTVEAQKLLSYAFRYYETHKLYSPGAILDTREVWKGHVNSLQVTVPESVTVTLPRGAKDDLVAKAEVDTILEAPIRAGDEVGELIISLNSQELVRTSLVSQAEVKEAGFFKAFWHSILLLFSAIFG